MQPTRKQLDILKFIERYTRDNKIPPTLREIGAAFDLATAHAGYFKAALMKKGLLAGKRNQQRNSEITEAGKKYL